MTTKRKTRRLSVYPQSSKPYMSLPASMTSNTINTDPVKRAIATPLASEQRSPKPPSIFPMSESTTLQASPASPPSEDEDEDTSPPPPPSPFPWLWRCHSCSIAYRLSCTRRCLLCSHQICSATLNGDIVSNGSSNSGRPAKRRRRSNLGGPCTTEFDYLGWAAWGSWRRERNSSGDAFAMFEPIFVTDGDGGAAEVVWEERAPDHTELVERRKRDMYASGAHDCSLHCDFPSECHNSVYSAARERAQLAHMQAVSTSEEDEEEDNFQATINDIMDSAISSQDDDDEETVFDHIVPWYDTDETSNDDTTAVEIDVEDVYELYAGSGIEDDTDSDMPATSSAPATGIVVTTTISTMSAPLRAPVQIAGLGASVCLANGSAHSADGKEQFTDQTRHTEESGQEPGADGVGRVGRAAEGDGLEVSILERDDERVDAPEEELTSPYGVEGAASNGSGEREDLAELVRLNTAFMRGEL